MRDCVVADSTFYSCCACDIKRKDILYRILSLYPFFLGEKISGELPVSLTKEKEFSQRVSEYNFDYFQLIKPFFGRSASHVDDGEYEAIGIGYMLDVQDKLRFLILDDRRPNKFAKAHFVRMAPRVTGTIGFIREGCCADRKISPEYALEFLSEIQRAVTDGGKERPCSITRDACRAILIPTIEYIRKYHVGV